MSGHPYHATSGKGGLYNDGYPATTVKEKQIKRIQTEVQKQLYKDTFRKPLYGRLANNESIPDNQPSIVPPPMSDISPGRITLKSVPGESRINTEICFSCTALCNGENEFMGKPVCNKCAARIKQEIKSLKEIWDSVPPASMPKTPPFMNFTGLEQVGWLCKKCNGFILGNKFDEGGFKLCDCPPPASLTRTDIINYEGQAYDDLKDIQARWSAVYRYKDGFDE